MGNKLQWASGLAVAATLTTALIGAAGSAAEAETTSPSALPTDPIVQFTSEPVIQPLPGSTGDEAQHNRPADAASLSELAAAQPQPDELSPEIHCLAGAIYFEARGEPLSGQLAVASVVVERARSHRFPDSYCGVVFQRSQFSFVRGKSMPAIANKSQAWRNAVAIAEIADAGSWDSPAEGALFFHAAYVSPDWPMQRMARIGNHIFYR